MVRGATYTIHRRLAGEQFDQVVETNGVRVWVKQEGAYTDAVWGHAIDAAGEADSATADLDAFQLPATASIRKEGEYLGA